MRKPVTGDVASQAHAHDLTLDQLADHQVMWTYANVN
jgi:hypothetical protein